MCCNTWKLFLDNSLVYLGLKLLRCRMSHPESPEADFSVHTLPCSLFYEASKKILAKIPKTPRERNSTDLEFCKLLDSYLKVKQTKIKITVNHTCDLSD